MIQACLTSPMPPCSRSSSTTNASNCWPRCPSVSFAIVIDDHGPLVVPVNYALDGDVVVFRSGAGSKLRALRDAPLSFQVDLIDPSHRTGWSVLIRGTAHEATDARDAFRVDPWAPGAKQHWIRVVRPRSPDAEFGSPTCGSTPRLPVTHRPSR